MESVMQARRSKIKILYNGRDVSRYVINFSYTDNYDQTDDISITLYDREKHWVIVPNTFFKILDIRVLYVYDYVVIK